MQPLLATLAVFDQQPLKNPQQQKPVLPHSGAKERSIKIRSQKNSPKLSPRQVKRISETVESPMMMPSSSKPFGNSGIPKPTAAVKGTAKIIARPVEVAARIVRTPGDGKEVLLRSSIAAANDNEAPEMAPQCIGEELETETDGDGKAEDLNINKVSPMLTIEAIDDCSNGNQRHWVSLSTNNRFLVVLIYFK